MKRLLPLAALFLTLCLSACSGGYTAQEPCAYCGDTPTKEYTTDTGDPCYVCETHSTTCAICNEPTATRHFTNGFGFETFICEDCYETHYAE